VPGRQGTQNNKMNEFKIPEFFIGGKSEIPPISVFPYYTNENTSKNRVVLTAHAFVFLTEGDKEVVMGNSAIKLSKDEFVLITSGKCLMTEKTSDDQNYSSTLFFFDNNYLQTFFEAQKAKIQGTIKNKKLHQKEASVFKNDDFTRSYVQSLKYIANKSQELVTVKLNEILLYLLETQPLELCCLFAEHPKTTEEINFKNIIASHIDSNLSVGELAYLCNMSLSTFKRKFKYIYEDSPTNWIRKKRMEHAAFLLKYNKERVSDIYLRLGYENHSSFTQSFKSVFGVSP
jgi:AraC-like DNA-binding protein